MKILGRHVLYGPNLHSRERVIRLIFDRDACRDWPPMDQEARATDLLAEVLPELDRAAGEASSLIARLRRGERISRGAVVAEAAIALQALIGGRATFAASHPSADGCEVLYGFDIDQIGILAGQFAVDLVDGLTRPKDGTPSAISARIDPATTRASFLANAQPFALLSITAALVGEAERRNIPWVKTAPRASYVQFGQGRFRKLVSGTVTSDTPVIGDKVASSKSVQNIVFRRLGLPVADQRTARSVPEAVRAAEAIGYPVVIKPVSGGKGQGVTVGLVDAKGVADAFVHASQFRSTVVVESVIPGEDFRLLVVGGKLIAAAKRIPAHVVGDGIATIAALIEAENQSFRRRAGAIDALGKILVDDHLEAVLAAGGRSLQTIPAKDELVQLRRNANLSTGGTPVDVTASVHPDVRRMAERAALIAGIDVAGVDFLTRDISRSHKDVGGAICEINTWPHLNPHCGSPGSPDVVRAIMELLYPPGTDGRIPTAAVTGTNGKTTTCAMLARILRASGRKVGMCSTNGVHVDGHEILAGDWAGGSAARLVLADPLVDAAVLETARGGIINHGLGFDRCDVAAVTNLTEDHLGVDGIETLEQMAEVKALVVAAARHAVVLNAEDSWCDYFAGRATAPNLVLVAMDENHPRLRAHLAGGGTGTFAAPHEGRRTIVLRESDRALPLIAVDDVPATFRGRAEHNTWNAIFAAAIAHALGVEAATIARGLGSFECDFATLPARGSIHDAHGFRVILDYGHNPASMTALRRFLDRMEVSGKRIAVLQLPGNRRDAHFAAVTAELAGAFDHYVCYQSDKLRGRADGELPRLLRDGLVARGVAADRITLIPDQRRAIEAGLLMARPGDLVLVLVDNAIHRCWRQIVGFEPRHAPSTPAHGA